MAEDKPPPPPSGWRALVGFVQQGQVLLAVAVAGAGLLFNFDTQRRAELAINRTAVDTARGETVRSEFQDDPHNTLVEFKATFPHHAFCAALGFFIAENGRLNRSMLDRPDDQVRQMNDALLLEVEALAAEEGIGAEAFARFRAAAAAEAARGDDGPGCAGVQAERPVAAFLAKPECMLAIDSFGQNACNIARWTEQRREAIRAEQVAIAAAPAGPAPPAAETPSRVPGVLATPTRPVVAPAERAALPPLPGPGEACGGTSPLVFVQFTNAADRSAVEAVRDRLLQAGWQMAPAEATPTGRTSGDLRIYWEDQRPCAEALAGIVGGLPEVDRPIRVLSLADRYNGLPHGQMELWLPALH